MSLINKEEAIEAIRKHYRTRKEFNTSEEMAAYNRGLHDAVQIVEDQSDAKLNDL